jgi:hypothetical protein
MVNSGKRNKSLMTHGLEHIAGSEREIPKAVAFRDPDEATA